MAVNTVRAFLDPVAIAAYMGLPPADPESSGFVLVYALRAAFLALAALSLLARGEKTALGLFAAAAVVMPVGDAALTISAGAPLAIVARHAATAIYLALTAYLLLHWARANAL